VGIPVGAEFLSGHVTFSLPPFFGESTVFEPGLLLPVGPALACIPAHATTATRSDRSKTDRECRMNPAANEFHRLNRHCKIFETIFHSPIRI
jgi:hypothetical protein